MLEIMVGSHLVKGLRLFSTNLSCLSVSKNAIGGKNLVDKVAVTADGKMVVAWHPESSFPYELSKPIPKAVEVQTSTIVKEEALCNATRAFKDKHPEVARQELTQITFTTKHRWFPRSRDKKAKNTPMDRPYL